MQHCHTCLESKSCKAATRRKNSWPLLMKHEQGSYWEGFLLKSRISLILRLSCAKCDTAFVYLTTGNVNCRPTSCCRALVMRGSSHNKAEKIPGCVYSIFPAFPVR